MADDEKKVELYDLNEVVATCRRAVATAPSDLAVQILEWLEELAARRAAS